jgi:FAD dependent oxidoreductase TIGR03364
MMYSEKISTADIAIVGGGIVGLAHAYHALLRGLRVVLFERDGQAVGASVRNFGLIWPIGQEPAEGLNLALRSRTHWIGLSEKAGFRLQQNGSLHLAYHDDEWQVLQEFVALYQKTAPYHVELLSKKEVLQKSPVVKSEALKGALWSATECTVNPREAIASITTWLISQPGFVFRPGTAVTGIENGVITTSGGTWQAQHIFVCNGADFATLYPEVFSEQELVKCKLQMMKLATDDQGELGPTLCAGLTLRHYPAFQHCTTLVKVDERYDVQQPEFKTHGIHVLVSQHAPGEWIVGDSHTYSKTVLPFDSEDINNLILAYMDTFMQLKKYRVVERWHGVYPKKQGSLYLMHQPERGVMVVNALGGAGMTLSFGLAEKAMEQLV